MKKVTLLTATALTLASMGGSALTAQAAFGNRSQLAAGCIRPGQGNSVIVSYGSCDDFQSLLDKLKDCVPGIVLPECNLPGSNRPGVNVPETDCPENNAPEVELPDVNVPGGNGFGNDNVTEDVTPEVRPGEKPEQKPEQNPEQSPEQKPEQKPEQSPEQKPEQTPEQDTEDSTDSNVHPYIQQVVNLVNAERAKEGLAPLTVDTKVQAAAQVRAKECEKSFSHTRPNGTSFATALKEQNVSYRSAGENIAWGQRSPQEVVNAWMNSSGHRANIMNANFTTIGVGYYQNANGTNYWCQLFTR